jgi:predicted MFS family arabinose efflux permease
MASTVKQSIWQNRNFVILLSTGFLLSFGSRVYELALPLIIYELTQSSVAMGTMRALQFLPIFLFGMVIGVFVDRADKKRWMLTVIGLQTMALFSLYFWASTPVPGDRNVMILLNYGYVNARITSVKWALPTPMMTSANAKFTFIQTLMQVMGPAISGAILFLSSLYLGLLITAVMYFLGLLALTRLQLQEGARREERTSFSEELRAGWLALRQNQVLWVMTLFVVFFNASSIVYELMVIFFVKDELFWSTAQVGIVMSCAGIGGLLGSLLTERIRRAIGIGGALALSLIVLGLTYSLTGYHSSAWSVGVAMFAFGFMTTMQNICIWAYRHETTPAPLIGRVSGMTGAIFKIGVPLALLGAGVLADIAGARMVFMVCGVVQALVFLVFMRSRLMAVR